MAKIEKEIELREPAGDAIGERTTVVEIIRDVAALQSLAAEWNALATHLKTPLLRHEWFAACAEAFCPPGQLSILVIRSGEEITAIAPLVLIRQGRIKRLELLGNSFLGEPSGFIYKNGESLRELVNALITMRKPMLLQRFRSECPEVCMLAEICQGRALFTFRNADVSPWLPITTSWAEFEAKISSSRRASFRRARRHAEGLGKVQFEIFLPDLDELERYLEEIFRMEAASWKGRNGSAMLSKPRLKHFFWRYSQAAARLRMLCLCFLKIDGKAIAGQLAIKYANRFWVLKIGYDEAWAQCSPGILLMHETIRHAFEQGLEAYEFLGTDAPWIHVWTDQVRPHVLSRIYPYSLRGLLGLGIDMYRWGVSKARTTVR